MGPARRRQDLFAPIVAEQDPARPLADRPDRRHSRIDGLQSLEIVRRHAPGFDGAQMEMRASSGGKYVSLTCTITATSKAQLDALYRELSGHPLVKVVL